MADFSIEQIPGIMDKNKWPVAAALMRRWFAGVENSVPEKGIPCLDIVKMDWVLGFERAKAAYDRIFQEGLWKSPKARKEMYLVLGRRGFLRTHSSTAYGRREIRLPQTHSDHIQYVRAGGGKWEMATAKIDQLTAALARFNFHVVALGGTEVVDGSRPLKFAFTIVELAVYVRDSYDFNDEPGEDQDLGRWHPDDGSVSRWVGGTHVHNSDFRAWRAANKKGGDYLIFSDLKYEALPKPETIILEPGT